MEGFFITIFEKGGILTKNMWQPCIEVEKIRKNAHISVPNEPNYLKFLQIDYICIIWFWHKFEKLKEILNVVSRFVRFEGSTIFYIQILIVSQ